MMQRENPNLFVTSKSRDIQSLFLSERNVRLLNRQVKPGVNTQDAMKKFAIEVEIDNGESVQGNIEEALSFLNQMFLDEYGQKNDTHTQTIGKYPKVTLARQFKYDNLYSVRDYDAQYDQRTFRDNNRFRYRNKIMPWQQAGHKNRHYTENDGLRLGTMQEKESIGRGFAMETILATNRYNTKPDYNFDYTLGLTDRLQ